MIASDYATGDGVTDDTAGLQAALDAAAGGHLHIPKGVYLINPATTYAPPGGSGPLGLRPSSHTRITLDPGAILQCTAQAAPAFRMMTLHEVTDVTIEGGQIIGDKAAHGAGNHGHGIALTDCTNIRIQGATLRDHYGDCLYLDGYAGKPGNQNIVIRDCTLTNGSRQGISVTRAEGVLIESCRITDISGGSTQYGIDVESDNPALPCNNVTVRGCHFARSSVGGLTATAHTNNLRVLDCTFDANLCRVGGFGSIVSGCTFIDTMASLTGSAVRRATALTFADNVLRGSRVLVTVHQTRVDGLNLSGNTFTNPDATENLSFIQVAGAGSLSGVIDGNLLDGSTAPNSITMVDGCRISNNLIRSAAPVVALIASGRDVDLSNNTVIVNATGSVDAVVVAASARGRVASNYVSSGGLAIGQGALRVAGAPGGSSPGSGDLIGPSAIGNTIHNEIDGGPLLYVFAPKFGAEILAVGNYGSDGKSYQSTT